LRPGFILDTLGGASLSSDVRPDIGSITMQKHLEHAAPFFGYLVAAIAGAACHHFFTPLVIRGTRQAISGDGLLPSGLVLIHPLGLLLYALPIFVALAFLLSYRFTIFRRPEFMAMVGCGFAVLFLAFAMVLAYPLMERGLLNP
jgi:hypothetical protein